MKRKNLFNLLIVLGIALALTCGVVIASRVQAQEAGPLAPQSAVDTSFTYQGRLIQSGGPVSDTCDFRFNLYDDASPFPSLVVGPVDKVSVTVSDGYFSTSIDFGADAFTGEGRQLGIAVRCPAGSGDYTDLSGLVMLHAAPYAHSLRPGAVISSSTAGAVLHAEDTYSGMFASAALEGQSTQGTGVRGETFSGYGVYGEATASSGTTYGVYGSNNSTTDGSYGGYFVGYGGVYGEGTGTFGPGVRGASTEEAGGYFTSTNDVGVFGRSENSWGVYGYAAGASGETYGVYGRNDSGAGYGVYGTAPTTGTVGVATASSGTNYGVYGEASSGYGVYGEGSSAGVYGESSFIFSSGVYGKNNHSNGTGVTGEAPATGVHGKATDNDGHGVHGEDASTLGGYGVYGQSSNGYGIYSEGDAHVAGDLTWDAKTSYVSVSAAAFSPLDDNYMYTNSGNTLTPTNMSSQYYYAPVQLPHGATVTKIEFYWSDLSGDYNGHCYLYRNDMQAGEDTLGTVDTSGSSGVGSSETSTITNSTIDNSQYAYYLGWDLDGGGDVEGYGVVIEYTITEPY